MGDSFVCRITGLFGECGEGKKDPEFCGVLLIADVWKLAAGFAAQRQEKSKSVTSTGRRLELHARNAGVELA